jgi:hypothetical protein
VRTMSLAMRSCASVTWASVTLASACDLSFIRTPS